MSLTEFPSPPDLKLEFKDMVLDGKNLVFSKYDVSNPHPGFGKDPNILNEYGHTKYPMYVGNVIVNNEEEEKTERAKSELNPSVPSIDPNANNPWPIAK